jgi:hypothetical protein
MSPVPSASPVTSVLADAVAERFAVSVAVAVIDRTEPGPRVDGTAMRALNGALVTVATGTSSTSNRTAATRTLSAAVASTSKVVPSGTVAGATTVTVGAVVSGALTIATVADASADCDAKSVARAVNSTRPPTAVDAGMT